MGLPPLARLGVGTPLLYALAAVVFGVFYVFIFGRLVAKHTARVRAVEQERRPFWEFFDKGSYEAAYSGFEGTIGGHSDGDRLSAWLRLHGITAVDVCGIATDYCVRATALDAAAEGFATRVLAALTAAVHPVNVPAVEAELAEAGVTSTG